MYDHTRSGTAHRPAETDHPILRKSRTAASDAERGNAYREFSTEDIRTLKLIKLFRKLDFPLATIAQLLRGETELRPAIEQQIQDLQVAADRAEAALYFVRNYAGSSGSIKLTRTAASRR